MTHSRIAVIHHLQQPFLGHAAEPLGAVEEHFGTLPSLDGLDGLVSLGGEQAAWEDALAPEVELIRAAVEREIPFLGICLGAQLLARATGGENVRLDRRLVTWHPLRVIADDPVLGAIPPGAHGLHWNEDGFEPPPHAVEVYERPRGGRAEGFRTGRVAWGVQFHPEIDQDSLEGWYREWRDVLAPAGVTAGSPRGRSSGESARRGPGERRLADSRRASVTEAEAREADARHLPDQAALSAAIFGAFARLVRTRPAGPAHS